MAGWHHRLDEYEFEQTLGDSEGQGSLVCCSPWGHKESDTTERPALLSRSLQYLTGLLFHPYYDQTLGSHSDPGKAQNSISTKNWKLTDI